MTVEKIRACLPAACRVARISGAFYVVITATLRLSI